MSSTNVAVAVRCRPISAKETTIGSKNVVEIDSDAQSITITGTGDDGRGLNTFTFDHVYPGGTSQVSIYQDIGAPLITKALEGFNGTVFAYGQTGSGKTFAAELPQTNRDMTACTTRFTMMGVLGDKDLAGIVPRLTDDLFERVMKVVDETGGSLGENSSPRVATDQTNEHSPVRFLVTVSFLEIYNEVIHDLLNPQADKVLKVREHPDMGIYVEHLCELAVKSPAEIIRLIDQGNRVRRVASTAMNERSSRSHSVLTVKIEQKTLKALDGGVERETALSSKLNLVDLAGSERADKTGAQGATLKEGAAINQSLMALGGVINALSEGAPFVPYRNSKLTRLLQESLGGNARTVMIANVSPAEYNAEETLGTLRYASRAKKIQNKVVRNEDVHERVIRELQEEIDRLRAELAAAATGSVGSSEQLTAEQEAELQVRVDAAKQAEAQLMERIANMERAKEHEWKERERLTAELEEERKNNLNRAVADVMSSVKQEKLALINRVRELQDLRAVKQKELSTNKDKYKALKKELEAAMAAYEQKQVAHDRLDKADPGFDASADDLLQQLTELETRRENVIQVRGHVGEAKSVVQALEEEIAATRAELQAAASTIAENDRLRAAIQEEERAAFQSQRDAYLQEQLAAEKSKLEEKKRELSRRESTLLDQNKATTHALATAGKRAELLRQELDMLQNERDYLKEQLDFARSDLEHAHSDGSKLEEELRDTYERLHKTELEVEHERSRTKALEQEIWERQDAETEELRATLAAKEHELRAMERVVLEHKANLRHEKVEKVKEEKIRAFQRAEDSAVTNAVPCIAEAKEGGMPLPGDICSQTKFEAALAAKAERIAELEEIVGCLKAENRNLERDAKEDSFKVFKGVMDVTTKDRLILVNERNQLQRLLKQSVEDILHLQRLNDEYKRELDLRRSLSTDD